jgi:hypothetical protein
VLSSNYFVLFTIIIWLFAQQKERGVFKFWIIDQEERVLNKGGDYLDKVLLIITLR